MTAPICSRCGAAILGGEPPHQTTYYEGNNNTPRVELYCMPCSEEIAWACWNEETMGPCPWAVVHKAGHA